MPPISTPSFSTGRGGARAPPLADPTAKRSSIFVSCHHDSQSYPEYVVAFKPAGAGRPEDYQAGAFGRVGRHVPPSGMPAHPAEPMRPHLRMPVAAGIGRAPPAGGGGVGAAEIGRARSKFGYTARSPDELTFVRGVELTILSTSDPTLDPGWWKGTLPNGQVGIFPANYVQKLFGANHAASAKQAAAATQATTGAPAVGQAWRQVGRASAACIGRAVAKFSYSKQFLDEMSIRAGDEIEVTDLHDPAAGWWVGRLKTGKNGFFPANHVTIEDSETLRSRVEAAGLNVRLLPALINRRDLPVAAQPATAAVTAAAAASSSAPRGPDRMLPGGGAARITRMAAGMSLVTRSATIARVAADFNGFCSMAPAPTWLRLKKISEEVYECSIDVEPEDDATVLGQLRAEPAVSTACTITLQMNFAGTSYPMAQPTVSVLTAGFVHPAVAVDRTFTVRIEHGWNPAHGCFPPGYNGLTLVELFMKATGLKMKL